MFTRKTKRLDDEFNQYGNDYTYHEPSKKGFLGKLIQFLTVIMLLMIIGFLGMFGYNYLKDSSLINAQTQEPENIKKHDIKKQTKTSKKIVIHNEKDLSAVVANLLQNMQDDSTEEKSYVQNLTAGKVDTIDTYTDTTVLEEETKNRQIVTTVHEAPEQIIVSNTSHLSQMDRVAQLAIQIREMIDNNQVITASSANTYSQVDQSSYHGNTFSEVIDDSDYTQAISQEISTRQNEMTTIIVRRGDTLSILAKRAYGSTMEYQRILDANPQLRGNPNRIYIGQRLRIPQ